MPLQERNTPLGTIYIAQQADGPTVNLRHFSSSADATKARWIIDIIGDKDLESLQGKVKKKIELKFQ